MLIKRRRGWEIAERLATPEAAFLSRRQIMQAGGAIAGGAFAATIMPTAVGANQDPTTDLYPAPRNETYTLGRDVTPEGVNTRYNNFYEFGMEKTVFDEAEALETRPWDVRIDGMVEKEFTVDIDRLVRAMPLEERLYRHRCVEAWSMTVPWSGFPLAALVAYAKPLSGARYLRMETFVKPEIAPLQRSFLYSWPYVEGLTMAEATNELAFIATGAYGKPVHKVMGAPLRLHIPWKYGFKSVKSIVRFTFTDERPMSFWENLQASEYGFWANVNPEVPHPRWSQASERVIGTNDVIPTQLFNGYGEYVADLYKDMKGEKLFM